MSKKDLPKKVFHIVLKPTLLKITLTASCFERFFKWNIYFKRAKFTHDFKTNMYTSISLFWNQGKISLFWNKYFILKSLNLSYSLPSKIFLTVQCQMKKRIILIDNKSLLKYVWLGIVFCIQTVYYYIYM